MCLIVCMYTGISGRNSFKGGGGGGGGGGECETWKKKRIFPKRSESVILFGKVKAKP